MWNYLQLILFSIVCSIKNKSQFGSAENEFSTMNEEELLEKLTEAMKNMNSFFQDQYDANTKTDNTTTNDTENENENNSNMKQEKHFPTPDELFGHLRGLFDGKIGAIAKEMAEEIANDIHGILGDDFQDVKSTKDVMEKLMKDPKKIANLINIVKKKLNEKMANGDISQEEMMKEVQSIFGKMGGMEGMDGMSGLDMKEFIKMFSKMTGKNMNDMNDMMTTMEGMVNQQKTVYQGQGVRTGSVGISSSMKDKMKAQILKNKAKKAAEALEEKLRQEEREKNYVPYTFDEEDETPKHVGKVTNNKFHIPGESEQPTTKIENGGNPGSSKKKKKNKK